MTTEIRELLELAAQSIGYSIESWGQDFAWCYIPGLKLNGDGEDLIFKWDPLTSGYDLIHLMDKLSVDVLWHENNISAVIACENGSCVKTEYLSDHPTRKAALAMAVVRCAAEWQRRKG